MDFFSLKTATLSCKWLNSYLAGNNHDFGIHTYFFLVRQAETCLNLGFEPSVSIHIFPKDLRFSHGANMLNQPWLAHLLVSPAFLWFECPGAVMARHQNFSHPAFASVLLFTL